MSKRFETWTISTELEVYASANDLGPDEQHLLAKAQEATHSAYAPYSNFFVGAALLLEDGTLVTGNNQENAAYPSGLCAERVALFHAGAVHPGVAVKAMAISCRSNSRVIDEPLSPCGACRQVIAEYEQRYKSPIRILMSGQSGKVLAAPGIEALLPLIFNRYSLEKK